jgi:TRAP-type C4-dicarboxylate transport system permease small subunit
MATEAPKPRDLATRLESAALWPGGAALLLLALLQVCSVLARAVGWVVPASGELALILVVVTVSSALVAATAHGSHPRVHALLRQAAPWFVRIATLLVSLAAFAYWLLLCIESIVLARDYALVGERTEILAISIIPLRLVFCLGLAAVALLLFSALLSGERPELHDEPP